MSYKKFLVLSLKEQSEGIIAIVLSMSAEKIFKGLPITKIRFIGTGEDVSRDYLDFILKKGPEEEAINLA